MLVHHLLPAGLVLLALELGNTLFHLDGLFAQFFLTCKLVSSFLFVTFSLNSGLLAPVSFFLLFLLPHIFFIFLKDLLLSELIVYHLSNFSLLLLLYLPDSLHFLLYNS